MSFVSKTESRFLDSISEIESLIEEDKDCTSEVGCLISDVIACHHVYVDSAHDYAEPGYSTGELGILFSNWNAEGFWDRLENKYVVACQFMPRLAKAAEHVGYEIEWSDEWDTCSDCCKAFRTKADSYMWKAHYYSFDCGDSVCGDCIKEDPAEYLTDIMCNPNKAVTLDINLGEHGYVAVDHWFENGLHEGQDANPHKIASLLNEAGIEEYFFVIDSVGQFDTRFLVYVKADEKVFDTVMALFEKREAETKCEVSPATRMKRALKEASTVVGALQGDQGGVRMATINGDGTVDARIVSAKDFIDGNI